jgi:hypothetical protein
MKQSTVLPTLQPISLKIRMLKKMLVVSYSNLLMPSKSKMLRTMTLKKVHNKKIFNNKWYQIKFSKKITQWIIIKTMIKWLSNKIKIQLTNNKSMVLSTCSTTIKTWVVEMLIFAKKFKHTWISW